MSKITKTAVAVFAAAALVGGLAGCSSGSGGGGSSSKSGVTTISWSFWDQGTADKSFQSLADEVHKKDPHLKVKMTMVPFASYFTKLQSQLASGTTACIVSMQSLRLPGFTDALVPIEPYMKKVGFDPSEWNQGALKALQSHGTQYAIPYGMSSVDLYYNKDVFKKAGLKDPAAGWTIDDFVHDAQVIKQKTKMAPFGMSFNDLTLYPLLYAYNGALPANSNAKLTLTSPKMEAALAWYGSLATKYKVGLVPSSSSAGAWGEQEFVAGNAAMALDGDWNVQSDATQAKFNVGVVPLPQGPNGGGTLSANSGYGISKTCSDKAAAAKAISIITGLDGQIAQAKGGTSPARTAANDAFFAGLKKAVDTKTPGYAAQAEATMDASNKMATPFITTSSWDQVNQEDARQFLPVYQGNTTAKQALQAVQQKEGK